MKRVLNIILISLFSLNISAQTDEGDKRFSFVGGVNVSYLNGDDGEDVVDDFKDYIDDLDDQNGISADGGVKPRIGVHFGFGYDYFVADNIAINSGLTYSMKGFSQKLDADGTSTYGSFPYYYTNNIDVDQEIKIQLDYLDIPIGAKYISDEGFELSLGLVISILAIDKVDYDMDNSSSYYNNNQDEPEDYEDLFGDDPEGRNIGYHFGVGYHFNEKISVSFKMQQGGEFGEIGGDDENKNLTLQLSTSVYF